MNSKVPIFFFFNNIYKQMFFSFAVVKITTQSKKRWWEKTGNSKLTAAIMAGSQNLKKNFIKRALIIYCWTMVKKSVRRSAVKRSRSFVGGVGSQEYSLRFPHPPVIDFSQHRIHAHMHYACIIIIVYTICIHQGRSLACVIIVYIIYIHSTCG